MAHLRALLVSSLVVQAMIAAGCSEAHSPLTDAGSAGGDGAADAWSAPDGQTVDAWVPGPVDAWVPGPVDAHVTPASCTADDAQPMVCPSAICDGLDSYAWDGERCTRIDCGTCMGADCGHLPTSQAACEAAHASCVPQMCRATGGQWLFWAQECHHYQCGLPLPSECLVGMPVCNCGAHRSFDVARGGCFDDDSCPEVDPLPPQTLCESTGGTWSRGICCNTRCGQFCDLDCAADACACGPLQVFDALRGCVDDAECHVHTVGQECDAQVRCQDGLLCCQHCGGAGCSPTMNCQAPLCDSDPFVDVCGNNLLAP